MKLWVLTLVDTILLQRTTRKVTNDLTTDRLTFQTFPTFYFHFVTNSQISWIRNKFRKFRKHSDFKSSLSRISQTSSFGNKEIWQMMIQCTNQCQGEVPWFFFILLMWVQLRVSFTFLTRCFSFENLFGFVYLLHQCLSLGLLKHVTKSCSPLHCTILKIISVFLSVSREFIWVSPVTGQTMVGHRRGRLRVVYDA